MATQASTRIYKDTPIEAHRTLDGDKQIVSLDIGDLNGRVTLYIGLYPTDAEIEFITNRLIGELAAIRDAARERKAQAAFRAMLEDHEAVGEWSDSLQAEWIAAENAIPENELRAAWGDR